MQGTCRGMFYNKFTKDDQSATDQIKGLGQKTMLDSYTLHIRLFLRAKEETLNNCLCLI